jgi:molecular chaperone GrpE
MHPEHDQSQPNPSTDDAADISAREKSRTGETQVAALQVELSQVRDRWMRAEAEIANVRTRAKRDVEEARLFAVQKFAADVAEATENLRRGIDTLPAASREDPEIIGRLREGLLGVERSVLAILGRNGIERRDPTGGVFDPNLHQAMAEQQDASHPPGTVLQAWTPVWTINGRLLRPAMVVVAKASPPVSESIRSEED